jgi:hypothetical protein
MEEAMDKLTVLVGTQKDGYVFRLKPSTRNKLLQGKSSEGLVDSVFIAYDKKHDFEQIHGHIWDHVIMLLTNMSLEEVNSHGGFAVLDPSTDTVVYDSVVQHV